MAQSRKQQQAAKRERMHAAVKEPVVEVTRATAVTPGSEVVAPVTAIPTPARKKPAKMRHVRPARGATTAASRP